MKLVFYFYIACTIVGFSLAEFVRVVAPTGPIIGFVENDSDKFLGIPYAVPPVNENRFQSAKQHPHWTKDFNAINDPPGCPQECILPPNTCPEHYSEDCLFLNVFRPHDYNPSESLPVMVFFHGGNYKQGYSGGSLYDSSYIVNYGRVIYVTVNYRLGALGYLTLSNLGIKGNFALTDQITSLSWVQENIKAFGGNPNSVTIIGQSAGAGSAAAMIVSPAAKPLFHRAILHSNPFTIPFRTLKTGSDFGSILLDKVGCSTKDCLMIKTADEIVKAQVQAEVVPSGKTLNLFLPWTPVIDGELLFEQPLTAFQNGQAKDIPMLIGTVTDEGDIFIFEGFPEPVSATSYQIMLFLIFGSKTGAVLAKYPAKEETHDHRPELIIAANEFVFHCPNRRALLNVLNQNHNNLYLYHFDYRMSFSHYSWGDDFSMCYNKVCHGGELPFTFNSEKIHKLFPFTDDDEYVAESIVRLWTNFAHNSNPNDSSHIKKGNSFTQLARQLESSLPEWKAFGDESRTVYHIRSKSDGDHENVPGWFNETCNWWDTEVGYFDL